MIIEYYLQGLQSNKETNKDQCIGEDAFCYLAHLYGRKSDMIAKRYWYEQGVKHFQEHGYVCEHAIGCFQKLAPFYEKYDTFDSAAVVYQDLIGLFT